MTSAAIQRLAERVERDWARCGEREDAFPDIAAHALRDPVAVSFPSVVRDLFGGGTLPVQRRVGEGFGQPAITLFHGPRFDIEILCWREATPAIHEHGFCGAFRLVEGESIQTRFHFTARTRLQSLDLGRLERTAFERLVPGAVSPIRGGADMIHANVHLVDPGMTLVVRTHQAGHRERTFLPPGVAYDSAARTPELHKQLQMLDTLNALSSEVYAEAVDDVLSRGDAYETLAVMLRAGGHAMADTRFALYLSQLRARFGADGALLATAIATERRRAALVRMRRDACGAEARLAIACLLECRDRADFIRLLALGAAPGAPPSDAAMVLAHLLQPDESLRSVAWASLAALLDDAPVRVFIDAVAALADTPLDANRAAVLADYFEGLKSIFWLEPLLQPARVLS